jgi:type II secretory pathway component GspD/PulD (secretin)
MDKRHPLRYSLRARPFLGVLLVLAGLTAFPADSSASVQDPGEPSIDIQPISKEDAKKAKDAKEAYKEGVRAERAQDWQAAYEGYSKASDLVPDNHQYAVHRENARSRAVQEKMDSAERDAVSGRLEDARKKMAAAHFLDPSDGTITERLGELSAAMPVQPGQVLKAFEPAGEVHLETKPGNRSFDYRGTTQGAYEEVARQFGVDTAFDVDLLSRQVRFRIDDVDFATAMRVLGDITGTFWRPVTKHLFFVAQDTTAKRKQYDVSIVRTILLPSSETPEQMTEILRMVREIAGITRSDLDTRTRTITLRAGPRAVAIATDLIENLEKPLGQLVLEIEILEVDRAYARQLGLTPPQTGKIYTLSSQQVTEAESSENGLITVIEQVFGTPSSLAGLSASQISELLAAGQLGTFIPNVVAFGGGKTTFLTTLPGATANFSQMLSLVKDGRRILLRAEDGQPATFFVGERFPVSLAQYSASLGGAGVDVAGVSTSSFPTANYATGNGPTFVATASLRNNGFDDLIATNFTDNTISVLLNNADDSGTFAAQASYDVGTAPAWIATGDFNGDGDIDLAVANQNSNTISILLGNGDGTFKPQTTVTTGNVPVCVVAANMHDADGKGFLDLVVANHTDNTISIFEGNGDGTFQATATVIALPDGFRPSSIAAADFNADGHIDLAVTDQGNNSVSIFLGKGDGTFQARTDYPVGNSPVWVSTADVNADGILDLEVANNGAPTDTVSGDSVSILLGQSNPNDTTVGNGAFGTQTAYAAGNGPTSIAVADYNVDGLADLAVAAATDNSVALLLGQGPGTFGPFFELPVGTDPLALVSADFNADGRADLAVANNGSNNLTVVLNSASFTSGNGLAGTQFPGAQYLDIGLKVKATPRVHQQNEVSLQLNFEISSLTSSSFNGIPVISNQAIEQTVRLKENETSVLAGILQAQVANAINGTPGIANIPIVGGLLGDENVQDQDSELLILITPRMVLLAPRKDREIYAGQGAPEGFGALGPTRELREAGLPARVEPPPQTEQPAEPPPPPQQQQQQQQQPQPQPQPQGQPQTQPPTQPPNQPQP